MRRYYSFVYIVLMSCAEVPNFLDSKLITSPSFKSEITQEQFTNETTLNNNRKKGLRFIIAKNCDRFRKYVDKHFTRSNRSTNNNIQGSIQCNTNLKQYYAQKSMIDNNYMDVNKIYTRSISTQTEHSEESEEHEFTNQSNPNIHIDLSDQISANKIPLNALDKLDLLSEVLEICKKDDIHISNLPVDNLEINNDIQIVEEQQAEYVLEDNQYSLTLKKTTKKHEKYNLKIENKA
ncbi:hypothetical protein COBT_001101 [Conglomerata obtusa]